MRPRIAIPMPHSLNPEYAQRSIPQYERAVTLAGGEPVRIPLDQSVAVVTKMIESCDGVLLPGSSADVDPERFHAKRSLHTAAPDPRRDAVDDLLLADAYKLRKPVLGICYGLQSLNVFHKGSLIQHIPDFLPAETRAKVNHEAGKDVAVAHTVEIEPGSKLAEIALPASEATTFTEKDSSIAAPEAPRHQKAVSSANGLAALSKIPASRAKSAREMGHPDILSNHGKLVLPVNSSHHQSADAIGDGLRIVARCPADGIIEGLEGTDPDHFVVAVQWHPERSIDADEASRAIFRALIEKASVSG